MTTSSDHQTLDDSSKVPASNRSEFYSFLKNLGSFTGDLSALTCPSFLLSGDSILEYCTHWCDQPSLFTAISEALDSEQRMVAVCRWFISTLYGSYYLRTAESSNEKKPFNPILGEQLLGHWDDPETHTRTTLVVEQVSHHPPVSGVFLENQQAGIFLNAHTGQKSKFTGTTIKINQTGFATLHFRDTDEVYTLNFPDLYIRSLITGKPFMEIMGNTWIRSNKGYVAVFKYIGKPWFGGEYHRFKGHVYHLLDRPADNKVVDPLTLESSKSKALELFAIEGRWIANSTITDLRTKKTSVLFDATAHKPIPIQVAPLDQQGPFESRRLWREVSQAINQGDFGTASTKKSEIEARQREERKARKDRGDEWKPRDFTFVSDDYLPSQTRAHLDSATQAESGRWVHKSVTDKLVRPSQK
ncbi:Oxysterol-binding protein 4 [Tieghemiomyces parasiticus]|uniref:Oxysterol-binding protein 4 n=1 Tax=Tieghemiomyces parasiticus TaxID=78921 RepID=A0A9W7ZS86_9FUNG|nr:Oxysterol-binding protein 4 [Tieghemiomyces parasiticus]